MENRYRYKNHYYYYYYYYYYGYYGYYYNCVGKSVSVGREITAIVWESLCLSNERFQVVYYTYCVGKCVYVRNDAPSHAS